ncbi:MAG: D-alanyl-D-alanine carboxypeptidase, partial [Devosiaceae bacterium]|nr:D-alanyl-D-alanine carboxypeptidase [Devosiaceae bacterium]
MANPQLLVDMETGEVLFEQEAGQPWYPASLTKLTTALVVFNAIENGRINLETPVGISALAARTPGGKSGIAQGRAVKMGDALNLLIVKSANDIAVAIAQTVSGSVENFVVEMNRTAQNLGMSATRFANPHGLSNANQITSARDLAILTLAIRSKFPQYSALFATSVVEVNGNALESRNNLLTDFAGTNGMKTGYICAAGMNIVASVERSGRKLLAVVLGASSERERAELVGQMIVQYLGTD